MGPTRGTSRLPGCGTRGVSPSPGSGLWSSLGSGRWRAGGSWGPCRQGPGASSPGWAGLTWAAPVSQVSAVAGEVGGQGSRASEVPTDHLCPCPHMAPAVLGGRAWLRLLRLCLGSPTPGPPNPPQPCPFRPPPALPRAAVAPAPPSSACGIQALAQASRRGSPDPGPHLAPRSQADSSPRSLFWELEFELGAGPSALPTLLGPPPGQA